MSNYKTESVLGGWVTADKTTGEHIGPVFNSAADCWAWQAENLIRVRILVGASAAYACIESGTRSLDVRLAPGKSAAAAMLEAAAEMTEKAERMLKRARLIESASNLV